MSKPRHPRSLIRRAGGLPDGRPAGLDTLESRRMLSADFNHDSRADQVWHNKSSGEAVIVEIDANHASSTHALGTVPAEWDAVGYGDFNRDGDDDILWRNSSTGENVVWLMDGEAIASSYALPEVGANSGWEVGGVGDFGSDDRPDILWRNSFTGENIVWMMQDADTVGGSSSVETVAGLAWRIAGVADFSDDGRVDILWRNDDTGENAVWVMSGTTRTQSVTLPEVQGREWQIIAVGNLVGSSDPDILWRRSTDGANIAWRMDNTSVVTSDTLTPQADGDWTVGGGDNRTSGSDWNRDGADDILWLDSQNGQGLLWYLNGSAITDTSSVNNLGQQVRGLQAVADFDGQRGLDFLVRDEDSGEITILLRVGGTGNFTESRRGVIGELSLPAVADTAWEIAGVADFNGDESPDLLWRNTASGGTVVWLLSNGVFADALFLPTVPNDVWRVQAVQSNDADGTADIYWRNVTDGQNVVWTMNGSSIAATRSLFTVEDQAWRMGDAFDVDGNGTTDVVWVNSASSEVRVWFYDPAGYAGTTVLGELPTDDSSIVA